MAILSYVGGYKSLYNCCVAGCCCVGELNKPKPQSDQQYAKDHKAGDGWLDIDEEKLVIAVGEDPGIDWC